MALCPMVQFFPISIGKPKSVWRIVFSCILVPSFIVTVSLSPLIVVPNQTEVPSFIITLPITNALGAIQKSLFSGNVGLILPS